MNDSLRVFLRCTVLFATAALSQIAVSHGVALFAAVEGDAIHGKLEYHGGTPIKNAPVRAYGPDDELITETTTGDDGRFVLPISRRCDYRIVGDAGEGHLGSHTVEESELPPAAGGAAPSTGESSSIAPGDLEKRIQAAVSREIGHLREELAEHERATRVRDVLGGIGYLFGLAGLVILLKNRKSPGV